MEWLALILVLGSLIGVMPAVIDQHRRDRAGFWKTLRLFGVYLLYIFANIGVLLWLLSGPQTAATAAAAALFGVAAIFYGALWLGRTVPRYRQLPAWFDRFPSGLDYTFWAAMAAALAYALIA